MKILIWNTKENRPANTAELNHIINGNDMDCSNKQFAQSWATFPKENERGIVDIFIDSGMNEEFEIRALANER